MPVDRYRVAALGRASGPPSSDAGLDDSQTRIFGSSDQGATWTLLTDFDVPVTTQWDSAFLPWWRPALGGDLGQDHGRLTMPAIPCLPRSEDGGLTWVSAVTEAFYDAFTGTIAAR